MGLDGGGTLLIETRRSDAIEYSRDLDVLFTIASPFFARRDRLSFRLTIAAVSVPELPSQRLDVQNLG